MSVGYYHSMCHRHIGRAVEIRTHDGRIHRGIIHRVHGGRVYLQPLGRRRNLGGFRWGWGWGFGAGIALGAIAAFAVLPFFWW
ncbi:hypothetical protein [Bacillus sp. S/N-304-OC-R1]|uniref:hypothetical protein n=1 Tax=Bacillus sp. S/N-304-OC-R1 TaxID=2758034 RepID=UPI001C8D71E3|nr:hypothetical protein [Bacillus sp. S/N-304-OC-R1]MBY0123755.1 hypothetical protein [Bacillus sp. S/N-304-OC-R1]